MTKQQQVEQIALTHYVVRNHIKVALKAAQFPAELQAKTAGNFSTFWDYYQGSFSDRFFDMGTCVRLGTAVEVGLRDAYVRLKGYANLTVLRQDTRYKHGIFQRIQTWHGTTGAISLFASAGVDLTALPAFPKVQDLMLHRHLYAHNSGVIDDDYASNLRKLTGEDILSHPAVAPYPAEDVYWFVPLQHLSEFIEAARMFFRQLATYIEPLCGDFK